MFKKLRTLLIGLLSVSLGFAGIVATEAPSYALNSSTFDPGLIVSDSVFFDWGTMNPDSIQTFLNARVSSCSNNRGATCIKNYREDVIGSAAIKSALHSYSLHVCADIPAATNQSAAKIIYQVAVACRINPRVLLVTLQKEQGLIQSGNPTVYMYKAAMGYGCPDSAPQVCGKDSVSKSRLFYQLYRAAWQLRWYGDPRGSFTYLKPGRTISMGYNPKTSCGRKSFKLKSQATANLYYYTPYTPNTAALKNLWGTGDSCSAYGNRNFWRQFWTWFGSPVAGGYLLKSSTSQNYLVNQSTNKRYLIRTDAMVKDFSPLGPLGTVSEDYINSFADAGDLKTLVSDAAGNRYLIASGLKYKVGTSAQAASLGLDWATAPLLTDVQISNFGNLVFAKSATTDEVFLLQGTTRALVSDPTLLETLSVLGSTGVVQDSVLNGFTIVSPVTGLVQDSTGNKFDLEASFKVPIANSTLAAALGHNWNSAITLSSAQLSKITTASFIKASTGGTYYLSDGTKRLASSAMVTAMSRFGSTAVVSAGYLAKFSTGLPLSSLLKGPTETWFVTGNQKVKVTSSQASALGQNFAQAALATAAQLDTLATPLLMKDATSQVTYLVDDYTNKHPISNADLAHYAGFGAAATLPSTYLNTFTTKSNPGRFVNSDDTFHYYLVGTQKFRVTSATVAQDISPTTFGTTPTFSALPTLTSAQLASYTVSTTNPITNYVKGSASNFIIEDGKLREVLDPASLTSVLNISPALSSASAASFSQLPLGLPIIADNNLFKNSTDGSYGIYLSGTFYPVAASLYDEIKTSPAWRITKSAGTLSTVSIAKLTQGSSISHFVVNGSEGYLLGAQGKKAIADIANVVARPSTISTALLGKIDTISGTPLTTPFVVKASASSTTNFLVAKGVKRQVFDAEETTNLLPIVNGSTAQLWSPGAINLITGGKNVIAPASVIKVRESGNIYLIDGWGRGLRISAATAKAFGEAAPKIVKRSQLTGYNTLGTLDWQKVICGNKTYVADNGALLNIDSDVLSQWPGTAAVLDAKTCQKLNPTATRVGLFVANGVNKYKVVNKKLRPIRTLAEYKQLSNGKTPAALVSSAFIASMAKLNPTSYVVVRGDSLAKVATKFSTTRATLRKLNRLTTDVLKVGQVLNLP